ncbi:hypothetical protein FRC04_011851 [Tulasnella sp. 424]|nr:hypothetical protein FRC04_011851 [Tulasnella sp. 424]
MPTCPTADQLAADQADFWNPRDENWNKHKIGWVICGICAILTTIITIVNVSMHARNYRVPAEQRQILRIIYLPMVYGIIAFLSYRFFSAYTYYSFIQAAYESVALSAFLLLLIRYVAATSSEYSAQDALSRKDKRKMPLFGCFRIRPSKPYFMHAVKWAVLQYAILKPLISIISIITEATGVLCDGTWDVHFAYPYLEVVDVISMTTALYGLVLFYLITKDILASRRPLTKFLSIKIVIFLGIFQTFVLNLLAKHGVIHDNGYWTTSNIVKALNAFSTSFEMVLVSAFMMKAYPAAEYTTSAMGEPRGAGKAIWDSINLSDFGREIWTSLQWFFNNAKSRREAPVLGDVTNADDQPTFDQAFLPSYSHSMNAYQHGTRDNTRLLGQEGVHTPTEDRSPNATPVPLRAAV